MTPETQIQHHTQTGETRCNTQTFGLRETAATGRLMGYKTAPITSRGLTAKTIEES